MANPIRSIGRSFSESGDIVETAARQDRERRQREDDDYYRRTGLRRAPIREYDPLVPINGRENVDIANDGDTYDENYRPMRASGEGYVEDNPTVIIEPVSRPAWRTTAEQIHNASGRVMRQQDSNIMKEIDYKMNEEIRQQIEKKKSDFNNSISDLDLDF